MGSQLEDEIESWKGFPGTLRKENRELWDQMIEEVRQYYAGAVERSGKPLTTDPFFMALLLAQQDRHNHSASVVFSMSLMPSACQ